MKVKIKRVGARSRLPAYATDGASGCDVYASEKVTVPAGGTALVPTGLYLEVPEGYECQVRPRSGLAMKLGLTVFNSPGTIDSDYRGEVKVLMHNISKVNCELEVGDRIAQFVFAPTVHAQFEEVTELNDTIRGSGGFGSTGVKD